MNKYEQLALAIEIAVNCHKGQYDKSGKPYILHPMHIMNSLMFDLELAAIGVLHDAVEDSHWKIQDLVSLGFSERITRALDALTHRKDEDYLKVYIPKICKNYDAIRVKRKDLEHNSNITRLKGVSEKDFERIRKYHVAFTILGEAKKDFDLTNTKD